MSSTGTGVAVSGVGYSDIIGTRTGLSESELAVQACRAALADAGLEGTEIDGLSMFPVRPTPPDPFAGPSLSDVYRALGITALRWHQSYSVENGQLGAVLGTIDALAAGRCTHAICYRAHLAQRRKQSDPNRSVPIAYDEDAYTAPYGGASGAARGALWATRYLSTHGIGQTQLGSVSVNNRAFGATNPRAHFRAPVTLEEYLDSRWIAVPLKLLDMDLPIDGATAIVLSRQRAARRTRAPITIESTGCGPGLPETWLTWRDKSTTGATYAARELWDATRLRAADVDVAEVYDAFSFFTLQWLEAFGVVAPGQAGAWLLERAGRLDTELPVNTDGGQLAMGRMHGFGKVVQATAQLRGEAVNQVRNAEVAVAAVGGGLATSALLLRR